MAPAARQYVAPDGSVADAADDTEARAFEAGGYQPATAEQIQHHELVKSLSNPIWAFGVGGLRAIPGAQTAVLGATNALFGKEAGTRVAQGFDAAAEASPYTAALSQFAGTAATFAIAPAGAGAAAAGIRATGAVGKAATAIKAGAYAAEGAGIAAATQVDEAAIKYAATPEGNEKIFQHVMGEVASSEFWKNVGLGAGLNAALNVVGPHAFKKLKGDADLSAQGMVDYANKMDLDQLVSETGQAALKRRGVLDTVTSFAKEHNLARFKTNAELAEYLKDQQKVAKSLMADARFSTKASLGLNEHDQLRNALTTIFKDSDSTLRMEVNRMINAENSPRGLQNLRMNLNKIAGAHDDPTSIIGARVKKANDILTSSIESMLASNPDTLAKWQKANRTFSAATNILNTGRGPEGGGLLRTIGTAVGGAAGGGIGYAIGGGVGAGIGGAIGAGTGRLASGAVRKATQMSLRSLAAGFRKVDGRAAQAIMKGLRTGGAQALTHALVPTSGFDEVRAAILQAKTDPAGHAERTALALHNEGVPGPLIDGLVAKSAQVMSHLNEKLPVPPFQGQLVAPQVYRPTAAEKAKLLAHVNAAFSPAEALENPTPDKLETLHAVYPESTTRAVEAVSNHAATQPSLPRQAREYASRLNGLAASGIRTPQVQAGLALLMQKQRMRNAMAQQQTGGGAQGGRPSGNGGNSAVASAQPSRTERLAN